MFKKSFVFGKSKKEDSITVSKDTLYSEKIGYGFLTEKNRNADEMLKIPEINTAFDVQYWYAGKEITVIEQDENGCYIDSEDKLPLSFKVKVPIQGNYNVKVVIENTEDVKDLVIYSQRRRGVYRANKLSAGERFEYEFTANVCDIIPRGKNEVYECKTVDVTIIGSKPRLTEIYVEQADVPTIYIAGDSTVTDQSAAYPYYPESSYSGWGQMISAYFKKGIAVSNHSHSGLTTETFRNQGHYAIVEKYIKAGDFFLIQFAHNDQKRESLKAMGGYAQNLRKYVKEIREKGAIPVIITPLSRTTWRGTDGGFNDLLADYAKACKVVGEELDVPVIDLHAKSVKFITSVGLEDSTRYFYPKDWTHTNDCGAFLMANYVIEEIKRLNIQGIVEFIQDIKEGWAPPMTISLPQPPEGFEAETAQETEKSAQIDRPDDIITRVEALDLVIKAVKFVPTNVYNDMYDDVEGHEWSAGTVECAYSNGMVDNVLLGNKEFRPNKEVTYAELISFCVNGYKSRKKVENYPASDYENKAEKWAGTYIRIADGLKLLDKNISLDKKMTRKEAADIVQRLAKLI